VPLYHEYLPATQAAQQELVLLHGWGCNREVWRPLLVLLRPWANVTLLDLPGCAPGLLDSGKAQELSDALSGILDSSPERAVYVGWSLGGQLALELAARNPERVLAVVTICSNPKFVAAEDWPGMGADVFQEFLAGIQADPVAALKRFDTLLVKGASQPRHLLREFQRLRRPDASAGLLAGLGWLAAIDQRESFSTLTQPQLHLLAERDALVPSVVGRPIAARMAGAPSGQVKVLPGCSHLAPMEAPVELAQEIQEFLVATGKLHRRSPVISELEKKDVAASFSRAAAVYDSVARLQRDVGEQLLTRLNQWEGAPTNVLDLGCGTGYFCPELLSRYPEAQYLGLDIAPGMVDYARDRCRDNCDWLVADAEALPLASESIDLVFSSLAVQWCYRPEHLFAELARVLRPGGVCVFTSLGPATLYELRSAWAAVDSNQHVNTFLPTSELESAARRIPGAKMKLECRAFRMEYARVRDLLDELKALGAHNMNRNRPTGLTSRRALQGMLQAYETRRTESLLPATYDVIFGVLEKV
jgi:malonyl-CoA O-methyltransferase